MKNHAQGWLNPAVSMNQSEPQEEVLYLIQRFLKDQGIESRIRVTTSFRKNPNHVLYLTGQERIRVFLELLIPFLVVKKQAAEEALALLQQRQRDREQPHWRSRFSLDDRKKMARLLAKGKTQEEVSRMFGTSQVHVGRLVKQLEVPV